MKHRSVYLHFDDEFEPMAFWKKGVGVVVEVSAVIVWTLFERPLRWALADGREIRMDLNGRRVLRFGLEERETDLKKRRLTLTFEERDE